MPAACGGGDEEIVEPVNPIIDGPVIPPNDIPSSTKDSSNSSDDSDLTIYTTINKCRIHNNSVTLLNNGMALHAYTTVNNSITDTTSNKYNINRIYISKNKTTLDVPIIANRDVSIAPKGISENFEIYVDEDVYNAVSDITNPSVTDLYVLFNNRFIGYQSVRIIGRRIDEYTGDYIVIAEVGNTNVSIDTWMFCVNATFYRRESTPDRYIDGVSNNLNYVTDEDGNILQTLNVVITSNEDYIGTDEESYVYLIAEAYINNSSQLFFYSFSIGKDNTYIAESYGWKQLTSVGNNSNPKAYVDKTNTLHVF